MKRVALTALTMLLLAVVAPANAAAPLPPPPKLGDRACHNHLPIAAYEYTGKTATARQLHRKVFRFWVRYWRCDNVSSFTVMRCTDTACRVQVGWRIEMNSVEICRAQHQRVACNMRSATDTSTY